MIAAVPRKMVTGARRRGSEKRRITAVRLYDMTRYDYLVTLSRKSEKTVKVAELKAQLSAYLRAARRGQAVTVCDRDTPVARLIPYDTGAAAMPSRPASRPWGSTPLPPRLGRPIDSLTALLEERQSSR